MEFVGYISIEQWDCSTTNIYFGCQRDSYPELMFEDFSWNAFYILDTEIKQRLSSLCYVKKVVETKMRRLNDGVEETDSLGLPSVSYSI